MEEKLSFIKWFTNLNAQKRSVALSIIIIVTLSIVIYGFGEYFKTTTERDRKECIDNNIRLANKCTYLENRIEKAYGIIQKKDEYHLKFVEEKNKKYEDLYLKTKELENKKR